MIRQAWGDLNYQLTKMLQGIPSSHHHGGWALGWKVPETLNATFTASSTDKICPLWLRERKGLMYQNTILALKDMSAIAVITVKRLGRFQSGKALNNLPLENLLDTNYRYTIKLCWFHRTHCVELQ